MNQLPIDKHLQDIKNALEKSRALILEAPPGTGKTTRVPAFLAFDCGLKVVVLEPRRLAARQAAARVASERGLTHGEEVGHAFRFEANWNSKTQLLFATEGTFLRLLEKQAFKPDVIILDEFHERHLDSDLALALIGRRHEKFIIMSATLNGLNFEEYFKRTNISNELIQVDSPLYPLEISYLENNPAVLNRSLSLLVLDALEKAFKFGGDVLVFLPGVREILETQKIIHASYEEIEVLALHGKLSVPEQAKVFNPTKNVKVILSTNVAESSVTVPGVRVVIDSGLARHEVWNPSSGLSILEDTKIAKSNAIQRAGRAAREASGLCIRLYSKHDFEARVEGVSAELHRMPLESACLTLAAMKAEYEWFELPNQARWNQANSRLQSLGALDEKLLITSLGIELNQLPLSPAWGKVVLELKQCDQLTRGHLFDFLSKNIGEHAKSLQQRIEKIIGKPGEKSESLEKLLLRGFVSNLARLKNHEVVTATGKTLKLNQALARELSGDEWGIIFDVDSFNRVNTFLSIDLDWLYELEPLPFVEKKTIEWNDRLFLSDTLSIGSLVIEENKKQVALEDVPEELKSEAEQLVLKAKEKQLQKLKQDERFYRLNYVFNEMGQDSLTSLMTQYLVSGLELEAQSFFGYLESMAQSELGKSVDELAPWKINDLKIIYSDTEAPHIMNFIQFFYGLKASPVLPVNQKPLTLKLQGPHKRAVQVTNDLAGFWQRGYKELLKEMRREYPRHHWPDNPENAPPILLKRQLPS